jgi:LacI family transcriptional regulator
VNALSTHAARSVAPAHIVGHPKLSDVAALAGVSIKTVSRVLNDAPNVSPDTARRVHESITLLGYRSNVIARELRGGGLSNLVGMVISDLGNPFYAGLAAGAEETISEAGLDLILATARDDGERERALINSLLERRVRGLMIVPSGSDYSYLHADRQRGFSFVFVDRPAPFLDADTVIADNEGGIRACVGWLQKQGCKRIALMADLESIWTAEQRIAGFWTAAAEAGYPRDALTVISGVHTAEEARERCTDLLMGEVDGIIAANDLIALGVGEAAQGREGIRIISFDDFPSASLLGVVTLNHDARELGRLAAETLLARFENPTYERYLTEVVPVSLRGGAS